MRKKKLSYRTMMFCLLILIVIGNILAFIPAFCDSYRKYVYRWLADGFGFLTGLVPFAVGEILMYIGAVLLAVGIILSVLLIFLHKKEGYRRHAIAFDKFLLAIILIMLCIYTFQWMIPFRCTKINLSSGKNEDYTIEQIQILRNFIVDKLNDAAKNVPRNRDGQVQYDKDISKKIAAAMRACAGQYPPLAGYYPPFKEALCHDFLDWMGIGGYTYPYTMEVTRGRYITDLYFPSLYAHEMAHHKGYYQENEANFLSYLACSQSEDAVLRYSAYYDMYYYVDDAYWESLCSLAGEDKAYEIYAEQPMVEDAVWNDEAQGKEEVQKAYEEETHYAEEFSTLAEEVAEVGWNTQSDILGAYSYDGVVLLLLQYYDGILYNA